MYVTPRGELDTTLSVNAKYVILTGPPPTLNRYIEFDPPLPASKRQLFERLPLGNSVKAMLVYEKDRSGKIWVGVELFLQVEHFTTGLLCSRTVWIIHQQQVSPVSCFVSWRVTHQSR